MPYTNPEPLSRLWRYLTRPFRLRVYVFEHTRVEVRTFPPRFRHERVQSLQERMRGGGGTVTLEACSYVLYEPVELPYGTTIQGAGNDFTRVWSAVPDEEEG